MHGAGDTRRKGRNPKEPVCPLFSNWGSEKMAKNSYLISESKVWFSDQICMSNLERKI